MPAILSAIFSAIYASAATKDTYGNQLIDIFPAMKQVGNKTQGLDYVIGVSEWRRLVIFSDKFIISPSKLSSKTRDSPDH